MTRPIIGVLLDYEAKGSFSARPHYALRISYFDAIWRAGGTPIALPYIKEEITNYMAICKGFLFPGGIYPFPSSVYDSQASVGEKQHPRYQFEYTLLTSILQANLPILGICAGMQLICATLGGKLFNNISTQTSSKIDHLNGARAEDLLHEVSIEPSSLLFKILGVNKMRVNSAHQESLKKASPELVVNAVAPDGIVEGIEAPRYKFCMGVQWHPEFFAKVGDPNFNLFKQLVLFANN